jgi:hypothetical protein
MKVKSLPLWSALALSLVAAACEKSSPAAPSDVGAASATSATVTDASSGVTVGAPQPVSPADNAQFRNVEQPVKLVTSNGVTTGSTALTYTYEVATDSGFGSIVYRKENVAEGTNQTTITLDRLGPDRKYYWRARSNAGGGTVGPTSRSRSFTIGPEVILQTPVPASPAPNATITGRSLTLTVNNVARTGPAGQILYRFEVADSTSFTNLLFVSTVPEGSSGRTSVELNTSTAVRGTYYWRVQASDPSNAVTTGLSSVVPFQYSPFSMRDATIWNNPADLADWAEDATILSIDFTPNAILVEFDKRTGPGRWPQSGFGDGGIQYTLGMCLNINDHWNCSAAIQFWEGRDLEASGYPQYIAADWFYDNRWGAMHGYQPSEGELVGIFVAQGNLRDNGKTSVKERSNVVIMPFGGSYKAR